MGFLDALLGRQKRAKLDVIPDRIWLTKTAKYAGVAVNAKERSQSDTVAILLIAHFPDVFEKLQEIVDGKTWQVPCKPVLANELDSRLAAGLNLDESDVVDIIVGERHLVSSAEKQLQDFAAALPCRCRFAHHVSIEDCIIRCFGGDQLKSVLLSLGFNEHDAIENNMVLRRIKHAQRSIENSATGSFNTDSADTWLQQNCPNFYRE